MSQRKKISNLQNQIEILYSQAVRVLIGSVTLALTTGYVLWGKVNNQSLAIWMGVMVMWSLLRAGLITAFYRCREKFRYNLWGKLFAISSGLAGAILGSAIFLTPIGFSFELSFLYIIFIGMIAGSVSSMASYFPAMYSFYLTLYSIVSGRMIYNSILNPGDRYVTGLAFLFVFTSPILLLFGKSINRWIKQTFNMYIEKELLTRRLVIERERLRLSDTVLHNVKEGVIITNHKKRVIYSNPAFCEITGYDHDIAENQLLETLFKDTRNQVSFENIWKAMESQGNWHGEIWAERPNGETYPILLNFVALADHTGKTSNYIAHFRDITVQKIEEEKLRYHANYDPLTGLPNRKSINDHLDTVLPVSLGKGALMFLDLNFFKEINDRYGHRIGDNLLQEVAMRLRETVRDADMVGRLGGDEFVVVLSDIDSDMVITVAEKLVKSMRKPFMIAENECSLSLSIGIAFIPDHGNERRSLMCRADIAMYEAKRQREGGRWVIYDDSYLSCLSDHPLE